MAPRGKNPHASQETQETQVPPLDWKDALEHEIATHSHISAWNLREQRNLPMGSQRIRHDRAHTRNTWSNRQIWPWSTEWSRAKGNRVLPRECTDHSKHPLPTTQEKTLHMNITKWSILRSDWLYALQSKWRSSIQSAKTRLGVDCGSDHELLIAKFRLKLKKVGKTTRPFRYDLNQIPYSYTWTWQTDSRD